MKMLKHYVVEVTIKQEFSSFKDVEASSKQEAISKAQELAKKQFSRELYNDDVWSELGDPKVVETTIEDEYEL